MAQDFCFLRAQVSFASLLCKGRGVVGVFRDVGVLNGPLLCDSGTYLASVGTRIGAARFQPNGRGLCAVGSGKRVLLLFCAVNSSKGARKGGGSF